MAKPYYKNIDNPTEYNEDVLELFHRQAIPGESLTGDPTQSKPWESPPEITTVEEGLHLILDDLFKPDQFISAASALGKGVSVVDLASQILYVGFHKGKWNPDLMLLMIEPLMYILLYVAERAGIKDVVGYVGEDEDDEGTDEGRLDALQTIIEKSQVPLNLRTVEISPILKKKIETTDISEEVRTEIEQNINRPLALNTEPTSLLEKGESYDR